MRFPGRVYGPGPLRGPGSRVLLAVPGVEYTDVEAEAIIARSQGHDVAPSPTADADAPVVPAEPDELGLIRRSNGWWELPNGECVRGRAKAEEAVAALNAGATTSPGTGEPMEAITADVGETVTLTGDGTGEALPDVVLELVELGGGWWQLPDGERIRGREEAEGALAAYLDSLDQLES